MTTVAIILLYLLTVIPGLGVLRRWFCLNASKVIMELQVHRLLTSSYFHTGPLHLIANVLTLVSLGKVVEASMGSTRFLVFVAIVGVLSAAVHVSLAMFVTFAMRFSETFWSACSMGTSTVLFCLVVVFAYTKKEGINLLDRFQVPNTAYPWILLLLFQCLPNVSFLGHLSGLLVGLASVHGLVPFTSLSPASVRMLEALPGLRALTQQGGFIPDPEAQNLPTSQRKAAAGGPAGRSASASSNTSSSSSSAAAAGTYAAAASKPAAGGASASAPGSSKSEMK